MTVNLNLGSDVEAELRAQAEAYGIAVEDYLKRIVAERIGIGAAERRLASDEWSRGFEEWADGFPEAPLIPDESLRRENLYPDRW